MSYRSHEMLAALAASLAVFVGCGSSALRYSGDQQRALVEPSRLSAAHAAPAGLRRLGHVAAGCRLADASAGLDGVPMSDVGCSTALLSAAVRERAAAAGGTVLVDFRCAPQRVTLEAGDRANCSADVWGPLDPAQPAHDPEPSTAVPVESFAAGRGSLVEAWRVLVDYWPAPGQSVRPPVALEGVGEIDFQGVGFVRLGDVRARGDSLCSLETLRAALLTAAARVGATLVVDVRCIHDGDTPLCVGSVAAPGQDDPLAEVR